MTAFPTYEVGTITVTANAASSVGVATLWSGANALPGDELVVEISNVAYSVRILDVIDATHITHPKWPGPTAAGTTYRIIKNSPQRMESFTTWSWVDEILTLLRSASVRLYNFVRAATRPANITSAGEGYWIKTVSVTAWEVYFFDGTSDILTGTFNPTAHTWTPANTGATGRTLMLASTALVAIQALGVREVLTANRTYYVRADGSDSNNGLANTSGGAFLTIQKAVDAVSAIDLGIYNATIQIGNGTYTGLVALKSYVGAGPVTIVGDETTPSNVLLSVSSGGVTIGIINADAVRGKYVIKGIKFTSSVANGHGILANNNSVIDFQNIDCGALNSGYQISAVNGGILTATGNYSITGGAGRHLMISAGSTATLQGATVTLTGTPAFSFFAVSVGVSYIRAPVSFIGSATGVRYFVSQNAAITGTGADANYFPGNSAGSATPDGEYS